MLRLAVLALLAGCFPPRFPAAVKSMPELAWASGDRSTYAYLDDGTLTVVRDGHKLVLKQGMGCYARPDRLVFAHDGRELYVLGAIGTACRIDTTSGASFPVPMTQIGTITPATRWAIGGFTGWLYHLQTADRDTVADRIGQRTAALPISVASAACDLIETPQRALIACMQGPVVDVAELDTSQFPPVLVRTRHIAVAGPSVMRFSRDGRLLAIWDQPVLNHPAAAHVYELDGLFEVARLRSRFPIVAIDLHDTELAVLEEPRYGEGELVVTTFRGIERQHYAFKAVALDVYWLTDGKLLATGFDGSGLFQP